MCDNGYVMSLQTKRERLVMLFLEQAQSGPAERREDGHADAIEVAIDGLDLAIQIARGHDVS